MSHDSEYFEGLLGRLQRLLGQEISVSLEVENRFFGAGFSARLDRVETLPGSSAVILYFANGVTVDLAPSEQTWAKEGDRLRLHLASGIELELSPASGT